MFRLPQDSKPEQLNITPYQNRGSFVSHSTQPNEPQTPQVPQVAVPPVPHPPEETNRLRVFRETGNYLELATVTVVSGVPIHLCNYLGVGWVGLLPAIALSHAYHTASAKSDKQRAIIRTKTYLSTAVNIGATLIEPISDNIQAHSAVNRLNQDYEALQPPKPADMSIVGLGALVAAAGLMWGLIWLQSKAKKR